MRLALIIAAREMRNEFDNTRLVAGAAFDRLDNIKPMPFALARPGLKRTALDVAALFGGHCVDEIIDLAHGKGRIAGAHQSFR